MPITLLAACNEALLMVGEREVTNFSSPVGRKARLALRRAQNFVGTLHAWRHLRATSTTPNWVGAVATPPPFHSVYQVYYQQSPTTAIALKSLSPSQMRYKRETDTSLGIPRYYAVVGEGQVEFYPQPTPAMQPLIEFTLRLKSTIASEPTDLLEGPDGYTDLVTLYAQVVLHRTHTTDLNSAEATAREFETSVHMYRTLDNPQEVTYMG